MDDMSAFERQVADELRRRAGPVHTVDAGAIFTVTASAARSPKRRLRSLLGAVRLHGTYDRPQPISATSGHTPTVSGRTRIMFSPAKSIIAGALVFAIGGALLLGQAPDPQNGSEPEAATEPGSAEPAPFTARLVWIGSDIGDTTYTVLDGHSERRGAVWAPRFSASDPRLEGRLTIRDDEDIYPGQEGTFFAGMMTWRLESEDGAWQGSSPYFLFSDPEYIAPPDTLFLAGEGAYEGLYAAIVVPDLGLSSGTIMDLQGVIFPAAPPAAPSAP